MVPKRFSKFKYFIFIFVGMKVVVILFFAISGYLYSADVITNTANNHRNTSFAIGGESMRVGETLQYFGNELLVDLNNDGLEDVVFLVTHQPGGSGVFYYAVAALRTENGYKGSDGYFLGDRIAPQSIEVSQNPRHRNVVVVNYADRDLGQPMTASPSVGKSTYLKLDVERMQWGIVASDFEGESR